MTTQTTRIDRAGRVTLPREVLDAVGIAPNAEVTIETTAAGIVIRPAQPLPPITARIAALDGPVSAWATMEREIEDGRLE
jgi:AbrB family looped-hinge helix DNA binding protein